MKISNLLKSISLRIKNSLIALMLSSIAVFASTSAQAAGELSHVTLTAVVYPIGAPQAFLKDSITHPYGIDVDVIYELQNRLGFKLKEDRIYALERADAFKRVQAGRIDIFAGGISRTAERLKSFDFTPAYYASCLGLLYNPQRHPDIKDVGDMKGMKIGISEGSPSAAYVQRMGGKPVPFTNPIMAYFQVYTGDLDGVFFDRPPLAGFVNDMNFDYFAVTPEGRIGRADSQYAIMMPKGSKYADIINKTISEMIYDGTMDKILLKWETPEMSILNSENY